MSIAVHVRRMNQDNHHHVLPEFVCPSCHRPVVRARSGWHCLTEDFHFDTEGGIPDFILPGRRNEIDRFLTDYQKIRSAEGWGSNDAKYYRDLPYTDRSGKHIRTWRLRARTFDCFLDHLLQHKPIPGMRILDIGAGNCWLAARLSECGFEVIAVDVNTDPLDGLAASKMISARERSKIIPVRADFDALPFAEEVFDVVIFNASLHYSPNVHRTLNHAMGVLARRGILYVLDSPMYTSAESGTLMIQERREGFRRRFDVILADEFAGSVLTFELFDQLAPLHQVEFLAPHYGFAWALRPIAARALHRREPARFRIVAVTRREDHE